jgi:hypothetical protein
MTANLATIGVIDRSSGSFDKFRTPASDQSYGSLTLGANSQPVPLLTISQGITGSIGSIATTYFRALAATASAHTAYRNTVLPALIVDSDQAEKQTEAVPIDVQTVLLEIEQLTGLKKVRIAEDLMGVTSRAYNAWERGLNMAPQNLKRVLETWDILKRASAGHPGPESLQVWLQTPRGARAERPQELIRAGEFGRARLLAMSAALSRQQPVADWILRSTPDPWTSDQHHWRGRPANDDLISSTTAGE